MRMLLSLAIGRKHRARDFIKSSVRFSSQLLKILNTLSSHLNTILCIVRTFHRVQLVIVLKFSPSLEEAKDSSFASFLLSYYSRYITGIAYLLISLALHNYSSSRKNEWLPSLLIPSRPSLPRTALS